MTFVHNTAFYLSIKCSKKIPANDVNSITIIHTHITRIVAKYLES